MAKPPTFPDALDEVKQVSIRDLRKMGFLQLRATVSGPITWSRSGNPSGSIGVKASLDEMFVEFDYRCGDKPIQYRVSLESMPRYFGGSQIYFRCPVTGKRCMKLYLIGRHFLSRYAYPNAIYSKQIESKKWRWLRSRLDASEKEASFYRRYAKRYYKGRPTKKYRRWLARWHGSPFPY